MKQKFSRFFENSYFRLASSDILCIVQCDEMMHGTTDTGQCTAGTELGACAAGTGASREIQGSRRRLAGVQRLKFYPKNLLLLTLVFILPPVRNRQQ